MVKMGWRQVVSETQGEKMLPTMTMETNPAASTNIDSTAISAEDLLFRREVGPYLFPYITANLKLFYFVIFFLVCYFLAFQLNVILFFHLVSHFYFLVVSYCNLGFLMSCCPLLILCIFGN